MDLATAEAFVWEAHGAVPRPVTRVNRIALDLLHGRVAWQFLEYLTGGLGCSLD